MRNEIVSAIRVGVASVKTNVVPMVSLWALAGTLVWGYYRLPCGREWLEPLAAWQREGGWVAAFLSRFVFCGLLPGVFMLVLKSLKVRYPLVTIGMQTVWSGVCGVASGWMFTLHAAWLGTGIDVGTLFAKTALQQFVWTPLFFAPAGAVVYFWIGRDFSLSRCRREFGADFLYKTLLPNLFANWIIWIPCALLIHMFPTPLQIQLTGLVNAFLCIVLLTIGRHK